MTPLLPSGQQLLQRAKRLALGVANLLKTWRTGNGFSDQDHDVFAASPGSSRGTEAKSLWTAFTLAESTPSSLRLHGEARTVPLLDCHLLPTARILSIYGHIHGLNLQAVHGSASSQVMREATMLSSLTPAIRVAPATVGGFVLPLIQERLWWDNYFHWTLDYLSQIIWAERHLSELGLDDLSSLTVIHLSKPATANYQRESLALFAWRGLRAHAVRSRRGLLHLRASNLLIAQDRYAVATMDPSCHNNQLHPSIINRLSETLTSSPLLPPSRHRPRIWISRRRCSARRVVNEAQLAEVLERHQIQTVILEDLTVAEQVALFRAATLVISPHGAGLTNLIYASQPAVLEFFCSGHRIGSEYFQITAIRGGRYCFHVLEPTNVANDMIVPLELLQHYLEVLLSS